MLAEEPDDLPAVHVLEGRLAERVVAAGEPDHVERVAGGADAAKAALRGGKRSPQGMFSRISRSLQSAQYDTGRAKAELGWKPRVDFEEAVRRVGKEPRG